ncbi:MAG: glycosyltransferase family 2 protein [Duncaniella sp.]|nr:glycosyltransferase family 2 protein [Duncaniella sp.]
MKKKVAVIILNWNGAALLRRYLPSVVEHTRADIADVIVADNGSTDDSLRVLADEFPSVETIRFDENHGFAGGYNRALAAVEGDYDYAVLLNSDVRVADDWLSPLLTFMEEHPEVTAVQPKIMSDTEPTKFEYAGAAGGYLDRHGYPYCRGRIFDTVETDNGQYDTPAEIHWASGAAMMVRIADYLAAGGLDEEFFAHMEEIDLCWRLRLRGGKIMAVPSAKVYHLGGGSLPVGNPRKTYLNFRNSLLMLHKNLPQKVRGGLLTRRRLLDTIAWARFLVGGHTADAKAILDAHRDFRRMRRPVVDAPKQNLLDVPVNILFDYYMRARRTFASLKN